MIESHYNEDNFIKLVISYFGMTILAFSWRFFIFKFYNYLMTYEGKKTEVKVEDTSNMVDSSELNDMNFKVESLKEENYRLRDQLAKHIVEMNQLIGHDASYDVEEHERETEPENVSAGAD